VPITAKTERSFSRRAIAVLPGTVLFVWGTIAWIVAKPEGGGPLVAGAIPEADGASFMSACPPAIVRYGF
jgi:hypothetical protein